LFKSSGIENIKMEIRLAGVEIGRPALIENLISLNLSNSNHNIAMDDIFKETK
jgi:hypothetical protein